MKKLLYLTFFVIVATAVSGFCITVTKENMLTDKNLKISGLAAIQEGQYVGGHHIIDTLRRYDPFRYPIWVHRAYARIRLETTVQERLHIVVEPEVKIWFDSYPVEDVGGQRTYPFREHAYVAIAEGQGVYSFGDMDNPFLEVAAGVFPYKFNADATNLGDYLFRTGCYPPYIETSFDYPYSRLGGLRITSNLFGLRQDLLLTTEMQVQPLFDWSLSYIIHYSAFQSMIDIGAGVMFDRLFPIDNSITKLNNPTNEYLEKVSDTSYEKKHYSFSGTKLAANISFDPKALLSHNVSALFGKEDLKLFVEAAVLGITNSPDTVYKYRDPYNEDSTIIPDTANNYYSNRTNRMPIMFGLNVPTFKLMDIFSIQAEWFGWPYTNTMYNQTKTGPSAIPVPSYVNYTQNDFKNDNWKWSIYLKKTLLNHFAIIGQLARDHTHHDSYYEQFKDENEIFTKDDEWGWWLKLQYSF